jgi:hypothetical protein
MEWVYLVIFIIVIAIVVATLKLAIQYWYITLALGAIWLMIYLIVKVYKREKRRQAAEAERNAEELARLLCHEKEQKGYHEQMIVLGERSIGLFELLPKHLIAAEQHLDQAEIDFAEGAFAPFWDSIEKTAKTLGCFDEGVHHIKENTSRYTYLIKKYENTPPDFSLAPESVAKLGVATATAERMKAIVWKAQRNFQFATIYEQRKTNKILVAGFTNLAHALDQMTSQIVDSIDSLTCSVDGMASTFNESVCAIRSRMDDISETTVQHHKELMKRASEQAKREREALKMLDNIQRDRRPSL